MAKAWITNVGLSEPCRHWGPAWVWLITREAEWPGKASTLQLSPALTACHLFLPHSITCPEPLMQVKHLLPRAGRKTRPEGFWAVSSPSPRVTHFMGWHETLTQAGMSVCSQSFSHLSYSARLKTYTHCTHNFKRVHGNTDGNITVNRAGWL